MNKTEAVAEIQLLKEKRKAKLSAQKKKRAYATNSRLDKFRWELLLLRENGASYTNIHDWLREKKRIKVALSTVTRWIKKQKELEADKQNQTD